MTLRNVVCASGSELALGALQMVFFIISEKSSINTNRKSARFPMSPKLSSYVAPKSPKGAQNAKRPFSFWNRTSLQESLLQSFFVWNLSAQSCRAFIGLTIHAKIIGGNVSFYLKFWVKLTAWSEIANFRSIFVRSASAVTSSEKSSIITNRKSTTRFLMSPRWTSYIVPKPPKGWLKNAKCPKLEQ